SGAQTRRCSSVVLRSVRCGRRRMTMSIRSRTRPCRWQWSIRSNTTALNAAAVWTSSDSSNSKCSRAAILRSSALKALWIALRSRSRPAPSRRVGKPMAATMFAALKRVLGSRPFDDTKMLTSDRTQSPQRSSKSRALYSRAHASRTSSGGQDPFCSLAAISFCTRTMSLAVTRFTRFRAVARLPGGMRVPPPVAGDQFGPGRLRRSGDVLPRAVLGADNLGAGDPNAVGPDDVLLTAHKFEGGRQGGRVQPRNLPGKLALLNHVAVAVRSKPDLQRRPGGGE